MKKFLLPILLLHLAMAVNAATYYFSSVSGDDSRTSTDAQSSSTPWRTINKLNSIMSILQPGDKVYFKRGESFDGAITVTASGSSTLPIIFAAYGTGNKPVINGFANITGWSQSRGNVWEASFSSSAGSTNMVVVNDRQQPIGRYPNSDAAGHGYLTINSHSGLNQISSNQLTSSTNWTGGEVVMRKMRWVTDRNVITNHSGNTLTFISGSGYGPSDRWGFFIQNHTNTLDQNGEWYYDNNRKKMQMYFTANNPDAYSIKGSVTQTLVYMMYQSYVNFNNLSFMGSNENTFFVKFCKNITINNCDIKYSGGNAIMANNTPYMTVTNTTVSNTNNNGIYLQDVCNNATVRNNFVLNTAVINGMGQSDADTYQAVIVRGDNSLIEYNEIDSSGFNPLQFRGDYALVKNNFINYYDYLKDDGAGIYNGLGSNDNTVYHSATIIGNIILNGIGATAGSDDTLAPQSAGIYLDDNSNHITVTGNTIANCAMAGINNHNAHELTISGNTMFNNKIQFQEGHDYISANPVRNCSVTNNIMFSKTALQLASVISTVDNDINQFGTFDGNYYCRPIDNDYMIFYSYYENGLYRETYNNLAGWQAKFGFDGNGKTAPVKIPASIVTSTSGVNKFMNGSFNKDVSYVSSYSPLNDIATTWTPSKIDGGTLQLTANNYSYNNNLALNLIFNTLTAGKTYMLSFSLLGSTNDKSVGVYLRKAGAPYTTYSAENRIPVSTTRTDYQFGIAATGTDDVCYIMFDYAHANGPVWVDNVQLQEAQVTVTNPDDYIVFQYNRTKKAKTVTLNGTYYDPTGVMYTDKVTLQPYTSLVLTKQAANGTSQFKTTTDASIQAMSLQGNLVNSPVSVTNTASSNLTWQVNNQRSSATSYEVERSSDALNFATIGNASVKKGSDASVSYNFTDAAPKGGKNYYRIKQYDDQGVYSYSKTIAINNINFRINPNPALDVIHILFDQPVNAADHLGKEVVIRNTAGNFTKTVQLASTENVNNVDINVSSLKPGLYILSMTSDGQSLSKTFLKQ